MIYNLKMYFLWEKNCNFIYKQRKKNVQSSVFYDSKS